MERAHLEKYIKSDKSLAEAFNTPIVDSDGKEDKENDAVVDIFQGKGEVMADKWEVGDLSKNIYTAMEVSMVN